MDNGLERKLSRLREHIRKLDTVLVAFSGGVDSTFLMRICREELGDKAVAVTALSEDYPKSELSMAKRVAKIIGIKHLTIDPCNQNAPQNTKLTVPRGSNLYSYLKSVAMRMKLRHVLDGSHRDDALAKGNSFLAARRAGVHSPLLESDLSKAEIRLLAKELGLPNWDKPASSAKKTQNTKPKTQNPKRNSGRLIQNPEVVKLYVRSICPTANIKVVGKKVAIIIKENLMVGLAKHLGVLRKKLKALGFSEIVFKLR
jgi:uncharacterized protein